MIATLAQASKAGDALHPASLRMNVLANPYAPAPEVRNRLGIENGATQPVDRLTSILIARISRYHRIAPESVLVGNGLADLLPALFCGLGTAGTLHAILPADACQAYSAPELGPELTATPRNSVLQVEFGTVPELHAGSRAVYCMSPNDPDGSQLRLQDAVSMARSVSHLIIDERHSAYATRDHLPLHREFDNVILVRTLETWGGLTEHPLAYAIADPATTRQLREHHLNAPFDARALIAGIASFEQSRYLDAAARRIAQERAGLIRALRKLNMVRPLPSAANFVLARLERGDRVSLRRFLDNHGILVHYPDHPGLEDAIRVSAISEAATRALCEALISWAREL